MSASETDQQVLTQYWQRLDRLSDQEWKDFYQRARTALLRCPASELAALPGDRDSYITEFFTEKIFFKAQRMNGDGIQSISGGALCFFFRNYLKDELRDAGRNPGSANGDDDAIEFLQAAADDSDGTVQNLVRQLGGHEQLNRQVQDFITSLEDWAMLMLRGHFCADDDDQIPMSALCKGIASYHYKAQKLGITVKKDDTLLGYEHTRIGQWITRQGIAIEPANYTAIRFLLEALCLEAAAIVEGEA